jgi:hypothetical protein
MTRLHSFVELDPKASARQVCDDNPVRPNSQAVEHRADPRRIAHGATFFGKFEQLSVVTLRTKVDRAFLGVFSTLGEAQGFEQSFRKIGLVHGVVRS